MPSYPTTLQHSIGPAIRHLDEVDATSPFFLTFLTILIGSLEWNRALRGFA